MAISGSNAILSEEEIEAALSEIETSPDQQDAIPDLDDGLGDDPAPEPVAEAAAPAKTAPPVADAALKDAEAADEVEPADPAPAPASETPPASAVEPVQDQSVEPVAAPGATRTRGLVGRLLSLLPGRRAKSKAAAPPAEDASPADAPPRPRRSPGQVLRDMANAALDAVNSPFAWLSPEARRIVGLAGLVTMALALALCYLGPMLAERNSPVAFIAQKTAELESRGAATSSNTP